MRNKYSKYNNSGVDWFKEKPSHWESSRLKYVLKRIITGGTPDTGNDKFWSNDDEGYNWISISDMTSNIGGILTTKKKITQLGLEEKNLVLLPSETLIYSIYGSIGKVNRLKIPSTIHQGILGFINNENIDIVFLEYFLLYIQKYVNVLSSSNTQENLNLEKIKNIGIVLPPISEQTQIVQYLDRRTHEIDKLIGLTEKKIDLLKQKRTSLINTVVTKGLNPNVELKDSGVEWIGEIPKHWDIIPLKHICYMKGRIGWKGLKQEEFLEDKEFPYLITGHDIKNDKIDWDKCYHISEERYIESPEIMVQKEDLLFTKDGTIGKILYIDNLPGKTSLNSHLLLIRPINLRYVSKFLYLIFKSEYFLCYVDLTKTGTTFYGVSQETMMSFKGIFPPVEEQKEIVKYIDNNTKEINDLISLEQRKIDTLKEFRQSLISEVVTGKVRVCEEDISEKNLNSVLQMN